MDFAKYINLYIKMRFLYIKFGRVKKKYYLCTVKLKQQAKMKTYSTQEINRNYKIKVFGFVNGTKINTLVGVSGLIRILNGDEAKAQKFVARAFASGLDRTDCKVYGGVRVSFYAF